MHVRTYSLDGRAGPDGEVHKDDQAQLWLNGQLVLAVNLWGPKVALTLTNRLVFITLTDYAQLMLYGTLGGDQHPHVSSTPST